MMREEVVAAAGRLVRALASAHQASGLYPPGHPERLAHARQVVAVATELHHTQPTELTLFTSRGGFYLGTVLLPRESLALGPFAQEVEAAGISALTFGEGLAAEDVDALLEVLRGAAPLTERLGSLRLNAVRPAIRADEPWQAKLAELRRVYAAGITALRTASDKTLAGETVDLHATQSVVEQLYDQVLDDPGYGLLLSAVKSYDEYTYFHMVNVCLLSVALGQAIGLRRDQVLVLGLGGLLHDIGKVFVPAEVLNSTGRLGEEEWRLVQRHPVDGAGMLLSTGAGLVHPATSVLLEHHASFDGGGYPRLHHHAPSVPSRLVAVADCFDAVTSKRSYRQPMTRGEALALLRSSSGTGFDPHAVSGFQLLLGRYPIGSLVELSSGEQAVVVRQHERLVDRPTVLVVFDATGTPTEVEERDLSAELRSPWVVRQLDPEQVGVDLPRFVASGQLHTLPRDDDPDEPTRGLVHEPSPGEPVPEGYVDTHNHPDGHHHPDDGDRAVDPDVAPPFA
jgi:HD-GYP domain-containing protein (c-di-GMP phosphodiesterase class II)